MPSRDGKVVGRIPEEGYTPIAPRSGTPPDPLLGRFGPEVGHRSPGREDTGPGGSRARDEHDPHSIDGALGRKFGRARVVDELAKVGFSDIRKVVTWRPELVAEVQEEGEIATKVWQSRVTVLDSSEIDDDTAAAIESVSQGAQGQLRVRMHDKPAALEKLARALGMFRDRHEHVRPDGKPLPVAPGIVIIETSAVPTAPKATSRPASSRNVARARRRLGL